MKYAYDRYARPNNDSIPTDPLLHVWSVVAERSSLQQESCKKQESCKNVPSEIHIVPGLPLVQDQSKEYVIERII